MRGVGGGYGRLAKTLSKIPTMSFTFSGNNVFDNIVIACKCH